MTERATLVANYLQRQKDVAQQKERLAKLQQEKEDKKKMLDKTDGYLKSLESIGQPVGEVLQKITDERIMVKAASGPRYVVGCRPKIDKEKLKPGVRITLDMQTYTIMSILPREVDPNVHNMAAEDPGDIAYNDVGGLTS